MRNAKRCGCSFSQSDANFAGERIQVNCASSCGCGNNHCHCQDSCRPKPCPPRPCPPRPCHPKPCPPRPCPPRPCPSCEDRCASQYRNCMRNCRWENDNRCGCRQRSFEPYGYDDYDYNENYDNCGYDRAEAFDDDMNFENYDNCKHED